MTNKITRRAFLKCTGAVAVAAGMAGALSGCDLIDGIMNDIMDQNGANGVTFNSVGVSCDRGGAIRVGRTTENGWDEGNIEAMYVDVDFSSLSRDPYTIKASDFTLEVDDVTAELLTGNVEAAKTYYDRTGDNPLFKEGTSVTLSAFSLADKDSVDNCYAGGVVVFKLPQEKEKWEKMTLKIKMNGGTAVFTGTPRSADFPDVADMKVNR